MSEVVEVASRADTVIVTGDPSTSVLVDVDRGEVAVGDTLVGTVTGAVTITDPTGTVVVEGDQPAVQLVEVGISGPRGEQGAQGPPGPIGDGQDVPNLTLVFENGLI